MSLFIISGASGTGKTSLIKELLLDIDNTILSISHTTRVARSGEENGVNYHFCNITEFEAAIKSNRFLEYAKVFGNYYGTQKQTIVEQLKDNKNVILEIDWQGAKTVRKSFPEAISIFIMPPSLAELKHRLEFRGKDSKTIINQRMQAAYNEMVHYDEYDYIVINTEFKIALTQLKTIILATQLTQKSQNKSIISILKTSI